MSTKKKQKPILADKIGELITPRPLLDPEIDPDDETTAKAIDYDVDKDNDDIQPISQLSNIRMKNVKLLHDVDAKYRGKVSSRKEFACDSEEIETDSKPEEDKESDSESDSVPPANEQNGKSFSMRLKPMMDDDENDVASDGSGTEDDDAIQEFSMKLNGSTKEVSDSEADDMGMSFDSEPLETWYDGEEDDEEVDGEEDDEEVNGEEEEDDEEDDDDEDEDESDFDGGDIIAKSTEDSDKPVNILPKKQTENHQQKGACVQNQLQIWEKLLEVRIRSQKMLITSNSLPNYAKFHKMTEDNQDFSQLANQTLTNATELLAKMRQLQTTLLKQYPETRELPLKRKNSTKPDESVDAKCSRLGAELAEDFDRFKDYRNAVITKWHDRTKVLTPGSVKSQQMHGNMDIMRKIEGVLANRDELVKKSQLYKGGYQLFDQSTSSNDGATAAETIDGAPAADAIHSTEIYDDTDFYHTQLRELIEHKTNTSSNSNDMAKQFAELQKLRKKMKKNVDTRASKGRKIRYVVHNKLVSFMAPNDSISWTEESKNELFRSLFGAQT